MHLIRYRLDCLPPRSNYLKARQELRDLSVPPHYPGYLDRLHLTPMEADEKKFRSALKRWEPSLFFPSLSLRGGNAGRGAGRAVVHVALFCCFFALVAVVSVSSPSSVRRFRRLVSVEPTVHATTTSTPTTKTATATIATPYPENRFR